ncbi:UDP-N-acetylmuramoyl-tripeptide--D-alanyl-D-alanine ligase, partial [Vibrio parahaemolyticus]|nr:UDP-N-acetylmuramoyl-tripeptide--D-alanyl-D-alanine ligase [Vibrio parahaemolyticus]
EGIARFNLHSSSESLEIELSLGIIGQHNVANDIAASIIALHMWATVEEIKFGLLNLNKVKVRVDVEQLSSTI